MIVLELLGHSPPRYKEERGGAVGWSWLLLLLLLWLVLVAVVTHSYLIAGTCMRIVLVSGGDFCGLAWFKTTLLLKKKDIKEVELNLRMNLNILWQHLAHQLCCTY